MSPEEKYRTANRFIAQRTTSFYCAFGCLFCLVSCFATDAAEQPPRNRFLADSHWPMSHAHPFNQGSTSEAGPTSIATTEVQSIPGDPVPITLAVSSKYPDGRRAIWGNTMQYTFKLDANDPTGMKYLAKLERAQDKTDAISGAYSVLDRDGFYFVPCRRTIEAFRDQVPGQLESDIEKTHSFTLPDELALEDELIVGMNMTFDGRIVFVTNLGLVGSLSRELTELSWLRLKQGDQSAHVSNSLAVDDEGRLIVVTNRFVACVTSDDGQLAESWRVNYQSDDIQMNGRLGSGSGTTPSLMGWGDRDKLVAIGDGQKLMHILLLWRGEIPDDWVGLPGRDRRIAAELPVNFGNFETTRSTTEQSLLVRGYDVAAVSNLYGELSPLVKRFVRRRMGNDVHNMTVYRSNSPAIAPHGIQKFRWNESANKLTTAWVRKDLSCPNGIPTMSDATGLMYFMGQREGHWTIEALEWETGEEAFYQTLSNNSADNSFYAATQVGLNGSLITGTFGGILRLEPQED